MNDDNRTNPRFGPLVIKTRVDDGGRSREGYLVNVSTGGAFLAVDDPPAIGTELAIGAAMPWRLGELRAQALVVWRNQESRGDGARRLVGVGVAFVELAPGSERILSDYLARFAELAASIDED